MKSISVATLGCKVNQYDTAAILNRLPRSRYVSVPFPEKADVRVKSFDVRSVPISDIKISRK